MVVFTLGIKSFSWQFGWGSITSSWASALMMEHAPLCLSSTTVYGFGALGSLFSTHVTPSVAVALSSTRTTLVPQASSSEAPHGSQSQAALVVGLSESQLFKTLSQIHKGFKQVLKHSLVILYSAE